jgi:hypothetical protein
VTIPGPAPFVSSRRKALYFHRLKEPPGANTIVMSTYTDQDNDAREEALSESEAPGQVLDPLADPIGTRGTQRTDGSEYEEEDARERPPEDGLEPEIPEDENLRVSAPEDFAAELDDARQLSGDSAELEDDTQT